MDKGSVFSKTGKGLLEIKNKSNRLPKDQLRVLNLVDGKTAFNDLAAQSRIPEIELRKIVGLLCDAGFIKELTVPADRGLAPGVPTVSDSAPSDDDLDFTKMLGPTQAAKPAVAPPAPVERPQRADLQPVPKRLEPLPVRAQEEQQRSRLEEELLRQRAEQEQRKAPETRAPPASPPQPARDDSADLDAELDALGHEHTEPSRPPPVRDAIPRPPAAEPPRPAVPKPAPQPVAGTAPQATQSDSPSRDLSDAFERARREAEQRAREEAIRLQQEMKEQRARAPRKPIK